MERIHDHAMIGDCRAAALVSRRGSIDWLCWPRFDSASVFGALLDDRAGHWSVRPTMPFESRQRYLEGTNVLETRFETAGGVVVVTHLMPVASEEDKHRLLMGEHEILRVIRCERGEVEVETVLRARPGHGLEVPRLRDWISKLTYDGPSRSAVERSALVLKLLVFAPSGAVVAAPTTSLPERVGSDLNWDYRFCWLRDASLTVRALFGLGFDAEAETFVSWLLHSTRLTQPELRILYDVYGNTPQPERQLDELSGYLGSRPVRVGNAATDQVQLDVYGEVIDAVTHFVRRGGQLDRETERMLRAFGEYVCRHWQEPDEGIWEPRTGKQHNTHSRVLCWVALDNLLALHERGHLPKAPVEFFAKSRDLIRSEVEQRAWNPQMQCYTAQLDGEQLDASTLLLSWYDFEPASSDRMRKTYARIRERLGAGDGLLYRYRLAESPEEAAFGICSFWGAEYLALGGGSLEEARALFQTLCGHANDVGLYAEEIDPANGEAVGNFPQAFTHVGLINAALSLSERARGEQPHAHGVPRKGEVEGRRLT